MEAAAGGGGGWVGGGGGVVEILLEDFYPSELLSKVHTNEVCFFCVVPFSRDPPLLCNKRSLVEVGKI